MAEHDNSLALIRKDVGALRVAPHLLHYEQACQRFDWRGARAELDGLPGGGLNIAHEALIRHAQGARADQRALRWLGRDGQVKDFSYRALHALANRFAQVLTGLGVSPGERVFLLCGRIPELYASVLGALQAGCVVSPLFSAFGPEPIAARLQIGEGSVLVTTTSLYVRKVASIRAALPALRHVLALRDDLEPNQPPDTLDLRDMMAQASDQFQCVFTLPDDPALLHFTSGTTGKPKGALHVHEAVVAHHATGKLCLDFHPEDVFWCTADPGWVTGTSYGIIAPLTHGIRMLVDEGEFDAERWYATLAKEAVSVWYTAPTAVRMMMKSGVAGARQHRYPNLRFIASVGEPLHPQAVHWGEQAFGLPIHDNWWQTETGGIMIANYAAMDIKPGSMGKPLPGIEAAIVQRQPDGSVVALTTPDQEGELALRRPWPSLFRAYLHEAARYAKCFAGDWYLTGDLARRDADGYYWFVGRADDVIKSAGHLIGPFEVESALLAHPAVAEAGVIGKPDAVLGEMVKAFVSLKTGYLWSAALERELHAFARKRLGAAVAPKEIAPLASLPKTRSGKIMRRLLKARELGLPEGDTSTLEAL